jgi:predicted DCC family thiol-disulfide oxidoreductase YuxK
MDARQDHNNPVLYWDADCAFCRRWVERWEASSGRAVVYRTLQTAPPDVIAAAGGEPFQRIVMSRPDGSLITGAHAALAALAAGGLKGHLLLRAYCALPPLRRASEAAYHWVAGHRSWCAGVTNLLWGRGTLVTNYRISGDVFPRLIGLIFVFAFLSLWGQIDGLAGSRGILPVEDHLAAVQEHFAAAGHPWAAWLNVPSLLWFGSSDLMLHVWLAVGTASSVALVLGLLPAASALAAWLCYLSFASAVPVFLNFQWDALLLEAGLLVVFYVPWTLRLPHGAAAPPRMARLLVWWLLFRLMFESGIVKLYGFDAAGRNTWLEGTALDYHYFTQPIPVWTSWWFAQLPGWFHVLSLVVVFAIELLGPFLMLGPRRLRMTAFWAFSLLMILIAASGHYGFFNLLTLVLCVSLVDDASWPAWLQQRFTGGPVATPAWPARLQRKILPWFALLIVVLTTLQLLLVLRVVSPSTVAPVLGPLAPLRSANSYGLFSVMTTERPEITIEASTDGRIWQPYRFRYQMAADDNNLPFLMPHMPRLDWQMWFAALEYHSSGQPPGWIMPLLGRLQERSTPVLGLLNADGNPESAPAFFRLRLELLTFASQEGRNATGRVWEAEPLPDYTIEGSLQR